MVVVVRPDLLRKGDSRQDQQTCNGHQRPNCAFHSLSFILHPLLTCQTRLLRGTHAKTPAKRLPALPLQVNDPSGRTTPNPGCYQPDVTLTIPPESEGRFGKDA